jgi:hypothetical protein
MIYLYLKYYQNYYWKIIISNLVWVLNNFLTMECYRKLCNKLYWDRSKPGSASSVTRFWLILLSAISIIWFAFFYDPTDPTNSNSPSKLVKLISKYFKRLNNYNKLISHSDKLILFFKNNLLTFLDNSTNILLFIGGNNYLKTSRLLI